MVHDATPYIKRGAFNIEGEEYNRQITFPIFCPYCHNLTNNYSIASIQSWLIVFASKLGEKFPVRTPPMTFTSAVTANASGTLCHLFPSFSVCPHIRTFIGEGRAVPPLPAQVTQPGQDHLLSKYNRWAQRAVQVRNPGPEAGVLSGSSP
ncbi:uncharacterized protein CLUP02_12407 [Colletotrichum lupini]|uniref:Uncharacterized protein n=1 Tax=Colletotrichum lupini TaxID=145971 RepID=A0A9Q8T170_9PEZI|nr:uncharacterized protein CLUP02_12407 [Colletotrichum lupini]UQC86905.1 hypothetical protein CLUP02_12407 [Colletotrichum lupini]